MYKQDKFVCYCGSNETEINYLSDGQTQAKMINNQFMVSNINHIVCKRCGLMFNPFYYNYDCINSK